MKFFSAALCATLGGLCVKSFAALNNGPTC